ncbi:MAG: response regulator [Elusimicrobia bacterium]|nr:response regulator [Elusimicrobiota bacterium]
MADRTFTTTEISRICDVYPATAINWIDAGKLKAYVTPGGHRRVTRQDLIEFLQKHKIPVPQELFEPEKKAVLIVDDEADIARLIERAFAKHQDVFTTQSVSSGVEAIFQIGQKQPDLLILDIVLPGMNGLEVCAKLRSMPQTSSMKIIAITGKKLLVEDELKAHGIQAMFKKPLELKKLVKIAADLLHVFLEPIAKEAPVIQT